MCPPSLLFVLATALKHPVLYMNSFHDHYSPTMTSQSTGVKLKICGHEVMKFTIKLYLPVFSRELYPTQFAYYLIIAWGIGTK